MLRIGYTINIYVTCIKVHSQIVTCYLWVCYIPHICNLLRERCITLRVYALFTMYFLLCSSTRTPVLYGCMLFYVSLLQVHDTLNATCLLRITPFLYYIMCTVRHKPYNGKPPYDMFLPHSPGHTHNKLRTVLTNVNNIVVP